MEPVQPHDTIRTIRSAKAQAAKMNPDIFRRYDIRGIYGVDFDDQFARELANKAVTHFGAASVLVARDGRVSGEGLERLVTMGVTQAGAQAVSIGLSTTPLFYWSVFAAKADLGIMITASHNPPQFNGFKVIKSNGELVGGEPLLKVFKEEFPVTNGNGQFTSMDTRAQYLEQVIAAAGPAPLNMAFSPNVPALAQSHVEVLMRQYGLTADRAAPLHVHMDPDADRVMFYENGEQVPSDFICALLSDRLGAARVVHDLRFSRSVLEYWKNKGIEAVVSRVGRLDMNRNMREHDADLGGEISSHFYFKRFNYLEAPELVLVHILRAMAESGKTLHELVTPYRKYAKSDEINLPGRDRWTTFRQRLMEKYPDGKITEVDGITVEFTEADGTLNWWCNLRPSNTEPIVRLIVEAKNRDLLHEKVSELRYLLQ